MADKWIRNFAPQNHPFNPQPKIMCMKTSDEQLLAQYSISMPKLLALHRGLTLLTSIHSLNLNWDLGEQPRGHFCLYFTNLQHWLENQAIKLTEIVERSCSGWYTCETESTKKNRDLNEPCLLKITEIRISQYSSKAAGWSSIGSDS